MKKVLLPLIVFTTITFSATAQSQEQHTRNSRAARTSVRRNADENALKPTQHSGEALDESRIIRRTLRNNPAAFDNRKEYMVDGQLATFTGHQASAVNDDEFQSLRKDKEQKIVDKALKEKEDE